MKLFKISQEEKTAQFIYIIVLWISFSSLFIVICFDSSSLSEIKEAHIVIDQIDQINKDYAEQLLNVRHIDTLRFLLSQYNPGSNHSYIESGITYEINELNKIHITKNLTESNIYTQLSNYYTMVLFDKKANSNAIKNCDYLKSNVNECEIGFQQNQNNITLQEAFKQNNFK